ncbi:uncharacterized protein TNCV_78861 [Trichonephila clavipes]|nr:uncharacterized protein TNCV_78861 [Trichonephila clavipes]
MHFKSLVPFRWMRGISSNLLPFKASLSLGNRKTSGGLRSVHSSPVSCPFKGPFTFNYSRGQGECRHPPSTIDTCTDDSQLLFRFQACADVIGTESSGELSSNKSIRNNTTEMINLMMCIENVGI